MVFSFSAYGRPDAVVNLCVLFFSFGITRRFIRYKAVKN
jgi:hypothetical protein